MQLTLDSGSGAYQIRAYAPGKITINAEILTDNLLLMPDQLLIWTRKNITELTLADITPIFALKPELVLFGTGAVQQFLAADLTAAFYQQRIGLEVMNTGAACRTYNVLTAENRKVLAALWLK